MQIELDSGSSSRSGGRSAGGKGCLTAFFLLFLAMGSIATIVILGEAVKTAAVWFWPEVDCTIISSSVEDTGDDQEPYTSAVVFEYSVDGRTYRGTKVARSASATSSYDAARRIPDAYPPGVRSTCRVHPEIPGEAVLERRPPFVALVVFLPLIFVAVGAGGIYGVWRRDPQRTNAGWTESISQRAEGATNLGRKIALGLGLIFAVVGGVLTVFLLVVPVSRLVGALTWVETPAVVEASTVRSWSTDDGTSYRADVLYEYTVDGRTRLSNRRTFFPPNSGGYDGSKVIVDRHPEGRTITCFVDPADPTRSVLDRSFRGEYLLGGIPLVFLLVGLGLTTYALRTRPDGASPSPIREDHPELHAAQLDLQPDAGPISKVIGMVIVAAIWNGIVGIFVWQAVQGYRSGSPEWFLMIFLIPFVLVGLALIGGIFYTFLGAFNPRPRLTIFPASPRLGTRLRVEWSFSGRISRIHHLRIVLEGHEKATYRRGTDTYTDRDAFISLDLVDTSADWGIARGSIDVEIPEDTMHSFSSANNAVVWALDVHGEIPRWPDVMENFEIEVLPLDRERLLPR